MYLRMYVCMFVYRETFAWKWPPYWHILSLTLSHSLFFSVTVNCHCFYSLSLSIHPSIRLSIYPHLSICLSVCLSVLEYFGPNRYLSICLLVFLSIYVCVSVLDTDMDLISPQK